MPDARYTPPWPACGLAEANWASAVRMSVGPASCRWSLTRFGGQMTDGAKVGLATELRYREKVMATTWSSRRDARIRHTAPAVADGRSASDRDRPLPQPVGGPGAGLTLVTC